MQVCLLATVPAHWLPFVRELEKAGHTVTPRELTLATGRPHGGHSPAGFSGALPSDRLLDGDKPEELRAAIADFDAVVWASPLEVANTGHETPLDALVPLGENLLHAWQRTGAKRFITLGSAEVPYAKGPRVFWDERRRPLLRPPTDLLFALTLAEELTLCMGLPGRHAVVLRSGWLSNSPTRRAALAQEQATGGLFVPYPTAKLVATTTQASLGFACARALEAPLVGSDCFFIDDGQGQSFAEMAAALGPVPNLTQRLGAGCAAYAPSIGCTRLNPAFSRLKHAWPLRAFEELTLRAHSTCFDTTRARSLLDWMPVPERT